MKCMIVEDELPAVKVIENHISHFSDLELVSIFHNAMDAFIELQKGEIDILFLDINLPKMNGIQLIHSLSSQPNIVLTTAHREFAIESYHLEVTDYLLKPISLERFTKSIAKVYKSNKSSNYIHPQNTTDTTSAFSDPFIYVKSEREYTKIFLKDIAYIESLKNHIKIQTAQQTYITLMSLSQIEERIPVKDFIRTHRSFIVGIHHISKFNQTNITVQDRTIAIGGYYKQQFMERMKAFLL